MVTLQFIPYAEIEDLSSIGRIRKLLNVAKEDKIVLLQGRLKKEEETELIKATMEEINKDFKGIELAVIEPKSNRDAGFMQKFRQGIVNSLLGYQQGITLIGPASIVKDIKKDPHKIELLMQEKRVKRRRRK